MNKKCPKCLRLTLVSTTSSDKLNNQFAPKLCINCGFEFKASFFAPEFIHSLMKAEEESKFLEAYREEKHEENLKKIHIVRN